MSEVDFPEHPVVWSLALRDAGSEAAAPLAATHPKTRTPRPDAERGVCISDR